jgi:phosphoglycerate dehydrogenase-like enzyme
VLSVQGAGYDWIDWQAATERGIPVLTVSGVAPVCVAEHVIAFMFCLAKRILVADRRLREGDFAQRDRWDATELEGKTLGIVGLGKIGRVLARKSSNGLGMRVIAVDPVTPPEDFARCGAQRVDRLDILLQESDYVSLHVPLLPETRHLIGARELALMKPTASLINTARGAVVDTEALVEALRGGRLAGAALDVFEQEPPPRDHPMFGLPNVVVTPHTAGFTQEAFEPTIRQVAHQVLQVLRGERPAGVVNPDVYGAPV